MLGSVDKIGYTPMFLGSVSGLFVPPPLGQPSSEAVWIEERSNGPALIQTSERGAPATQRGGDRRTARPFKTGRLAQSSRITASELFGVRAFGSEIDPKTAAEEVARRQALIRSDFELTFENMRLGAVQGLVTDADGSTIYDWASEFSQTIPVEVDFDLDAASPAAGVLRKRCTTATRSMMRALKGLGGNQVTFMGLCGDAFWDDLVAHVEIRAMSINWQAATSLGDPMAWRRIDFGGITFVNYRGTDDNSTVAVGTDKCKFFPVGAGIFQSVYAPGERFADLVGRGSTIYPMVVPDRDRDMWTDVELYSYPLFVCTMPSALYRAKRT
jgi:hypothetical protein